MISISFKDFMAFDPCERAAFVPTNNLVVDCSDVPRKSGRAALARGLDAPQPVVPGRIVRRKAVFRDRELAALFEWAADQLVIATPKLIVCFLRAEKYLVSALPVKLRGVHNRWLGLADGIASVCQWHDALEPEEMTFLPPEPWREVRS